MFHSLFNLSFQGGNNRPCVPYRGPDRERFDSKFPSPSSGVIPPMDISGSFPSGHRTIHDLSLVAVRGGDDYRRANLSSVDSTGTVLGQEIGTWWCLFRWLRSDPEAEKVAVESAIETFNIRQIELISSLVQKDSFPDDDPLKDDEIVRQIVALGRIQALFGPSELLDQLDGVRGRSSPVRDDREDWTTSANWNLNAGSLVVASVSALTNALRELFPADPTRGALGVLAFAAGMALVGCGSETPTSESSSPSHSRSFAFPGYDKTEEHRFTKSESAQLLTPKRDQLVKSLPSLFRDIDLDLYGPSITESANEAIAKDTCVTISVGHKDGAPDQFAATVYDSPSDCDS